MTLYFVRHGSSRLNAGDPSDPTDQFRGWSNVPLSDFGHKTVQQTAAWFKHVPVDALYSSDLQRARQTADAISKVTKLPVQTDERLRPWHIGVLTAQPITDGARDYVNRLQTKDTDEPVPEGESYNDFVKRYMSVLPELIKEAQTKNVIVVAHHRNALALPSLLYGKKTPVHGPPEPGGIVAVTKNGLHQLYTPPAVLAKQFKEKASS